MSAYVKDCFASTWNLVTCNFGSNESKAGKTKKDDSLVDTELLKTKPDDTDDLDGDSLDNLQTGTNAKEKKGLHGKEVTWDCAAGMKGFYGKHEDAVNIVTGAIALIIIMAAQVKTAFINQGLTWGGAQSTLSINFGLSGVALISAAYIYRAELKDVLSKVGSAIYNFCSCSSDDDSKKRNV